MRQLPKRKGCKTKTLRCKLKGTDSVLAYEFFSSSFPFDLWGVNSKINSFLSVIILYNKDKIVYI